MRLTAPTQLAAAALTGAAVGYLVVGTFDLANRAVPITPWSLPVMFAVLAAAAWVYAVGLARRVREARATVDAESAVRALVIGKSLLMTGAVLAGGHLVYALRFLGDWSIQGPRERVLRGLVTVLAGILLVLAGRRLERACMVPPNGGPDEEGESDEV